MDKNIIIPEGTERIGEAQFADNADIETIELPESLTEIGANAFKNCTSLRRVVLPDRLEKLGESAFEGCTALTEVIFSEDLRLIASRAFYGCACLPRIVIVGSRNTIIENDAFGNCPALKQVTLNNVWRVDKGNFENCDSLTMDQYTHCENYIESLGLKYTGSSDGMRSFSRPGPTTKPKINVAVIVAILALVVAWVGIFTNSKPLLFGGFAVFLAILLPSRLMKK